MPQNSWYENNPLDEDLDPISSLLSEWNDPEEEEQEWSSDFFQGMEGRRSKAAFTLMTIWSITIALHLISWGLWAILTISFVVMLHLTRVVLAKPESAPEPMDDKSLVDAPFVSILVAAKNEETVVGSLVKMLLEVDYPRDKYEVWVVDDYSSDRTGEILDKLALNNPQLQVIHRSANAGGGKSGALNQALFKSKGDIIGVFDADAKVPKDLLRQVVPMFDVERIGAVQVRKAIANHQYNFWTKSQKTEMALDSYLQQQRIAIGGIGELRGNGQFVRRSALQSCGAWNEETITDDLDLTIRLHLDKWEIGLLFSPAVEEEGVTTVKALWHQRSRWAEGGYQRYLDYWRLLLSNRLNIHKKIDLSTFVLTQYVLPTASVPDLLISLLRHHFPILTSLNVLVFSLAFWGMLLGSRRALPPSQLGVTKYLGILMDSLRSIVYMVHWMVVMPATTARVAILPKRLKWVKTIHEGTEESFV